MKNAAAQVTDFVPETAVDEAVLVVCKNCQTDNVVHPTSGGRSSPAQCEFCGYKLTL